MQKLKTMKLDFTDGDLAVGSMLENITEGKEILRLRKGTRLFSQGDPADAIYFVQQGNVKITVPAVKRREVVLARVGPSECFGRGCLAGQPHRTTSAIVTESSTVFRVPRLAMLQALEAQPALSERFIAALLVRNMELEDELCERLFNDREKRLARVLLKLSRYGQHDFLPDASLSQLSHESMADIVGTTRSRILTVLEKFERLGLVYYEGQGELKVRAEMLSDMVLAPKPSGVRKNHMQVGGPKAIPRKAASLDQP